jgi:hypothetical protein
MLESVSDHAYQGAAHNKENAPRQRQKPLNSDLDENSRLKQLNQKLVREIDQIKRGGTKQQRRPQSSNSKEKQPRACIRSPPPTQSRTTVLQNSGSGKHYQPLRRSAGRNESVKRLGLAASHYQTHSSSQERRGSSKELASPNARLPRHHTRSAERQMMQNIEPRIHSAMA